MLRYLLIVLLLVVSGCSTKNEGGVTGKVDGPQTITLPARCETTELARFHHGEQVLVVYKNSTAEVMKEELRCMMLKAIGDSVRRYQVHESSKPFGVVVFDMESMILIRYFMVPTQGVFVQEIVTPDKEKKLFHAVHFAFAATIRDVAIVYGAKGHFDLLMLGQGENTMSSAQFFTLLNQFLQSAKLVQTLNNQNEGNEK